MIERLSTEALKKMIDGRFDNAATCIIKFYTNDCHYCHALKDYYEELSQDYTDEENLHFFAFNIQDDISMETRIGFNGVPSIIAIKNTKKNPNIQQLQDPQRPNKFTWFHIKDIKNFIEEIAND